MASYLTKRIGQVFGAGQKVNQAKFLAYMAEVERAIVSTGAIPQVESCGSTIAAITAVSASTAAGNKYATSTGEVLWAAETATGVFSWVTFQTSANDCVWDRSTSTLQRWTGAAWVSATAALPARLAATSSANPVADHKTITDAGWYSIVSGDSDSAFVGSMHAINAVVRDANNQVHTAYCFDPTLANPFTAANHIKVRAKVAGSWQGWQTISGATGPQYVTGNRTASITVTTSIALSGGTIDNLVNGDLSTTVAGSIIFPNSAAAGQTITFDMGSNTIIDEFRFYQNAAAAHGTWQFQRSADNVSWANVGAPFVLGSASGTNTITAANGNTIAARYYRLLGVSGNTSSTPWVREIEFRSAQSSGGGTMTAAQIVAAIVGSAADLDTLRDSILDTGLSASNARAIVNAIQADSGVGGALLDLQGSISGGGGSISRQYNASGIFGTHAHGALVEIYSEPMSTAYGTTTELLFSIKNVSPFNLNTSFSVQASLDGGATWSPSFMLPFYNTMLAGETLSTMLAVSVDIFSSFVLFSGRSISGTMSYSGGMQQSLPATRNDAASLKVRLLLNTSSGASTMQIIHFISRKTISAPSSA